MLEKRIRLVDLLQLGPFSTAYHQAVVNNEFATALERFLEANLLPQVDTAIRDAKGKLTATFGSERYCASSSLVRNIFTLEIALYSDDGTSELKADIVFHPEDYSFSPRTGHDHCFYLWTPTRKAQRDREMETIQRLVQDIQRDRPFLPQCPICGGDISVANDSMVFDVRCRGKRCFQYNYHKDANGALVHGHFFTKHPAKRA